MVEVKPARAKSFVAKPGANVRVFLLFGPDGGLIREWSDALQRQVVDDPQDPFRLVDLDGAVVNGDAAALYDEARSMAFGGGQRVVKVRRLTGKIADAVLDFIKSPVGDARVLLEAPGATKQNAIVKAAIASSDAVAIPCYHDESRSLSDLVEGALKEAELSPGPGVVDYIVTNAGSDRALTRREIDKLALYIGADSPSNPIPVEIEQVQAVVGDTALLTIDSLMDATLDGRLQDVERTLQRVRLEGVASGTIIRSMANHVARLIRFQGLVQSGLDTNTANRGMRPPVHFSRLDEFARQARLSPKLLDQIMERLAMAERETRQTGMPDETICNRALSSIAVAVKRK